MLKTEGGLKIYTPSHGWYGGRSTQYAYVNSPDVPARLCTWLIQPNQGEPPPRSHFKRALSWLKIPRSSSSADSLVGVGPAGLTPSNNCVFHMGSHMYFFSPPPPCYIILKGRGEAERSTMTRCSRSPCVTLRWPWWLLYIFINNQLSPLPPPLFFVPPTLRAKSYFKAPQNMTCKGERENKGV